MFDLEAKFSGLKELEQVLSTLPTKLQNNVLRGALRAAAKPVAEEARRRVPVKSGRLRDSIRVTAGIRNNLPKSKVIAGGKGTKKSVGAWYAHMVEGGTAAHVIVARRGKTLWINNVPVGKAVNHPGARKQPFMRPAIDARQRDAIEAFKAHVAKRFTKLGLETPEPIPDDLE